MIKQLAFLLPLLIFACTDTATQQELELVKQELAKTKADLQQAMAEGVDESGFIHTVFFWMREGITEAERTKFEKGLQSLSQIETVERFYWGKAAGTAREVVDNSYDYALVIHFKDAAGQDAYQPHDIHQKFVSDANNLWEKVVVYDALLE